MEFILMRRNKSPVRCSDRRAMEGKMRKFRDQRVDSARVAPLPAKLGQIRPSDRCDSCACAAAAWADALPDAAMVGPLTSNPNPISFDVGPFGNIYVGGVLSGFGLAAKQHVSRRSR